MRVGAPTTPFIRFNTKPCFGNGRPAQIPLPKEMEEKVKEIGKKFGWSEEDALMVGRYVYDAIKRHEKTKNQPDEAILKIIANEMDPNGEAQTTWRQGEEGGW